MKKKKHPLVRQKGNKGLKSQSKVKWLLFGMMGTWAEYNYWGNERKSLLPQVVKCLKFGYDAHIVNLETNKVETFSLKEGVV